MKINLKVKRYDPEEQGNGRVWWQDYSVEASESTTVLDALIKVREEQDGTLGLRCSCRASICGSCGMRVNGQAKLSCKTRVNTVVEEGETLEIEPLGNHKVVRDLAVDINDFFNPLERIKPYLDSKKPPESGEYIASNESMTNLLTAMNCIMCGCCVSDCTVLEVDKKFLGPAVLAKAWRFVEDPRDDTRNERLQSLNDEDGGIWDCTRCLQCVEVCPKDVAPMERIMEMREMAIVSGNKNTIGYRHAESFNRSIKNNGRLDETRLVIESYGFDVKRLIESALVGVRAFFKGKMPPLLPHKADENEKIKAIMVKAEEEEES